MAQVDSALQGMIGMAELLLDETTLADAHRLSIQKIMRSGEILLEMVGMVLVSATASCLYSSWLTGGDELQDMGKVEAGKLELEHRAFRLEDVVADARIFCIAAQKKGLGFQEDIDRVFEGQVLGDMPRLRQVLANVLSNAIKVGLDCITNAFSSSVLTWIVTSLPKRARSFCGCDKRPKRDEIFGYDSRLRILVLVSRKMPFLTFSSLSTKRMLPRHVSTVEQVWVCALLAT